jgi:hypothetical protein
MLVNSGDAVAHGFAVVVPLDVCVVVAGVVSKKPIVSLRSLYSLYQPPTAEKSKKRSIAGLLSCVMMKLPFNTVETQTDVCVAAALALRGVNATIEDTEIVGKVTIVEVAFGVSCI